MLKHLINTQDQVMLTRAEAHDQFLNNHWKTLLTWLTWFAFVLHPLWGRMSSATSTSATVNFGVSDWRLILTSLVAAPAFVHGHVGQEETGRCFSVAEPASLAILFLSLPEKTQTACVLPAPDSPPSHFRPYHLSNHPRGNSRLKYSSRLQNGGTRDWTKHRPFVSLSRRLGDHESRWCWIMILYE